MPHDERQAIGRVSDGYRWMQLALGVVCMVMIANLQYGWTFFVPDIQKKFGFDRAAIQWAFTLFVLLVTVLWCRCVSVQAVQLPPQTGATCHERSRVCNLHDAN